MGASGEREDEGWAVLVVPGTPDKTDWLPHLRVAFPPKKPAQRENVVSALVKLRGTDKNYSTVV